jgi:RNA polymerase sigma-70 factor (ECF subfamily)
MTPKSLENPHDLEKAFLEWNGFIYGYVFLRVHNKQSAEDITQEVFFKAWRSKDTFNPAKSSLKTWLFTIAKNGINDYFNNSNKETVDIEGLEDKLVDDKRNIQEEAGEHNLIEIIMGKLKFLPERDQELITLRFVQDVSVKEIAEMLNLEYTATKVAIHRAIKKLSELCSND